MSKKKVTFNNKYCTLESDQGDYNVRLFECNICKKLFFPGVIYKRTFKKYNLHMHSENKQQNKTEINYNTLPKYILDYNDFLIVNSTSKHEDNHRIEDIIANLKIINFAKNMLEIEIPAFYCRTCNKYYILTENYDKLLMYGTPIVKIISYDKFIKKDFTFETLNERSKLNLLGYNVNTNEGISDLNRKNILADIIDCNFMTRNEIISHLNFLINTHIDDKYYNARNKWKSDKEFVENYKTTELRHSEIKTIKLYNYINK